MATLSIPITPERTDIARLLDMDGIIVEKHRRLATLLGLQSPPTRQSLINDMVHYMHLKESSVKLVETFFFFIKSHFQIFLLPLVKTKCFEKGRDKSLSSRLFLHISTLMLAGAVQLAAVCCS